MRLKDAFTAYAAGTYVIRVQAFMPDGGEKLRDYAKLFTVGGTERYDVAVTCLSESATPGKEISAHINLLNLGDYFQDTQLNWWVENETGNRMGEGSLPIALYNQESRSILRSVSIPGDTGPGNYKFRVQLHNDAEIAEGYCSFTVKSSREYYAEQQEKTRMRLLMLTARWEEKKDAFPAFVSDQIAKANQLMELIDEYMRKEDYSHVDEMLIRITTILDGLQSIFDSQPVNSGIDLSSLELGVIILLSTILVGAGLWIIAHNQTATPKAGAPPRVPLAAPGHHKVSIRARDELISTPESGLRASTPSSDGFSLEKEIAAIEQELESLIQQMESFHAPRKKTFKNKLLGLDQWNKELK